MSDEARASDPNASQEELLALAQRGELALDLALLQNPSCGEAVLREIYSQVERGHRWRRTSLGAPEGQRMAGLARHPNVPRELVRELLETHPGAALQNPALTFWQMEDPGLFSRISDHVLAALLAASDGPAWLQAQLKARGSSKAKEALAAHPATPGAWLQELVTEDAAPLGAVLAKNPNTPPEALWTLAGHRSNTVRPLVLHHPALPPADRALIQRALAVERGAPSDFTREEVTRLLMGGPWLQGAAFSSPALSAKERRDALAALESPRASASEAEGFRAAGLARNPSFSPDELAALWRALRGMERLAGAVAWALAQNPRTPVALLPKLAPAGALPLAARPDLPEALALTIWQNSPIAREALLRNPAVPLQPAWSPEELTHSRAQREALAAREDLSPALAVLLARDESATRRILAQNPRCPAPLLEQLADDEAEEVSAAAVLNPATPGAWRRERDALSQEPEADPARLVPLLARGHRSILVLAAHPRAPLELLRQALGSPREEVRRALGQSAKTPPGLITRLAEDQAPRVRAAVAQNPASPPAVLERLARDPDAEVRLAVARNRATPPAVLASMLARKTQGMPEALAGNPSCAPSFLAALAKRYAPQAPDARSVRAEVLCALAKNPATPWSAQARLGDSFVRERLQNPAVLALQYQGREGFLSLPRGAWERITKHQQVPAALRAWILHHLATQ